MIENEYSRQEDSYKQQIADLEEEKEQLQVSLSTCSYTSLNGNWPAQILFTVKLDVLLDRKMTLIPGSTSFALNDRGGERERAWDRGCSTDCKV